MATLHIPKISIITVNYNDAEGLERTLESVRTQTFQDFEHIVIDGGSTDSSLEVIRRHGSRLAYWCSEPDGGVYQGMNKGASHARGQYLLFLNAGDTLANPRVLQWAAPQLNGEDIVYGNLEVLPEPSATAPTSPPPGNSPRSASSSLKPYIKLYPDQPTLRFLLEDSLPHPSTFIRRAIFGDGYDTRFRIVADWHFWLRRILFDNCTTLHLRHTVSSFQLGGLSSNYEATQADRRAAYSSLFPPMIAAPIERQILLERQGIADLANSLASTRRLSRRLAPLLRLALRLNSLFSRKRR